jgi:multidrug efflux pump subunit AcrA (membrane-fusion protein)
MNFMNVETRAARVLLPIPALSAALLLVVGCGKEEKKDGERPPTEVTALTVVARDVPISSVFVAQTQSSQAVNIAARVSGFLDKRVYVEGTVVKAAQGLFWMDPKPFQAQVDGAAVAQSKAQLDSAQLDLSYTMIASPVEGVSSFAAVADGDLAQVTDPYTRMSLRLQAAFGLRRKESLKIQPASADRGDILLPTDSWTKGRRAREIPIRNGEQSQAQEYHDKLKVSLWEQQRRCVKPRRAWKEAVVRWLAETTEKATHQRDIKKLRCLDPLLGNLMLDEIAAVRRARAGVVTRGPGNGSCLG